MPGRFGLVVAGLAQGIFENASLDVFDVVVQAAVIRAFAEAGLVGHDVAVEAEVLARDLVALAQRDGALENIDQLAHVAGKSVLFQCLHGIVIDLARGLTPLLADRFEKVLGKQGNIAAPVAQCRHRELDDIEPIIEVIAEIALLDLGLERFVAGRQNTRVDARLFAAADRAHGLFLDDAQQLDLHRQRQVGDLVEKQGASVGGLKQAFLVGVGAGEAALDVAEELAFHQFRGNRAAVDRHEGLFGARTQIVDQPGGEFLAGAGIAADEHRGLAARQLRNGLANPLDGV